MLSIDPPDPVYFICPGESVSFNPAVTNGVPPYTYSWSPSVNLMTGSSTNVICNTPGRYEVTVTDKAGCTAKNVFEVYFYPLMPVNLGPDLTICAGDSVSLLSTDPGNYRNIVWSPVNGIRNTTVLNTVIVPDKSYRYVVSGRDQNGCTVGDTVNITVNPAPEVRNFPLEIDAVTGTGIKVKDFVITGGNPPYSLIWNGLPQVLTSAQVENQYNVVLELIREVSVYKVSITDENGCNATLNVNVHTTK